MNYTIGSMSRPEDVRVQAMNNTIQNLLASFGHFEAVQVQWATMSAIVARNYRSMNATSSSKTSNKRRHKTNNTIHNIFKHKVDRGEKQLHSFLSLMYIYI